MNYGAIQNRILTTNIGRSSTQLIADTLVAVNERQRQICNYKNWWFMRASSTISTVDGTKNYSLPTGYKDDFAVVYQDSSGSYVILRPIGEFDAFKHYSTNDSGAPRRYVIKESSIDIYPIPDDTYTIYLFYFGYLADFAVAADTNKLSEVYPNILIAGGTSDAYAGLQEYTDADWWEKRFMYYKQELNVLDAERTLPQELMIIPRLDVENSTIDSATFSVLFSYF